MNQITILVILIGVSFISASCGNSSSAPVSEEEIGNPPKFTTATPEPDFSVPNGWVLFPKPKADSREMHCANWSVNNEWKVASESGKLTVSKYVYKDDEQFWKLPASLKEHILKNRNIGKGLGGYLHIESYENGWLVGSDAGEWGGKLFWFSEDASQKTELLNDNVRGIARVGNNVVILSGLAHLGTDEGKIYRLVHGENGSLKTQLIIDLKTQPQGFLVDNDKRILVTLNNKILQLNPLGETEVLKETNFESLYPNSMAITSSGVVYVGMRLFIVRFVPGENGFTEEWLVPQNCQKFVEKEMSCVCQSS